MRLACPVPSELFVPWGADLDERDARPPHADLEPHLGECVFGQSFLAELLDLSDGRVAYVVGQRHTGTVTRLGRRHSCDGYHSNGILMA